MLKCSLILTWHSLVLIHPSHIVFIELKKLKENINLCRYLKDIAEEGHPINLGIALFSIALFNDFAEIKPKK